MSESEFKLDFEVARDISIQYLTYCMDNNYIPEERKEEFIKACEEILHYIMIPHEWEERFEKDYLKYLEEEATVTKAFLYHEYFGSDKYKERKAEVLKNSKGFLVKFYEGELLIETRPVYEHSERYAEDTAENWVLGVIG